MQQPIVHLFFACDDEYIPLLGVTLLSIKETCDTRRTYAVHVLHTGLKNTYAEGLRQAFDRPTFHLSFHDVSKTIDALSSRLHTRDYYSKSTYFRLFIPNMFPDISRALYLDCDILVQDNIADLFDTDLDGNMVGAVADGLVQHTPRLHPYVEQRVGVPAEEYFNAGVLLMDLDAMRRAHFEDVFLQMLENITFTVAQDQDYLNRICRGKCLLLHPSWNVMPGISRANHPVRLIHFNLDCKPWHKDGVPYADLFWDHALRSPFAATIQNMRAAFSEEQAAACAAQTVRMMLCADEQAGDVHENARIARISAAILDSACRQYETT